MLVLNVLRELRQPMGSVSELDIAEPHLQAEDLSLHDIAGTVRLLRSDRGFLAKVIATAVMDTSCARCLKEAQVPIKVKFEEEYVPLFDAGTGSPIHIDDPDEEVFRIDKRFDLDLREGLRQYILISEPAKPLCQKACAGLCANCGADLNAGPHECEPPADERWSALAGIKNKLQKRS